MTIEPAIDQTLTAIISRHDLEENAPSRIDRLIGLGCVSFFRFELASGLLPNKGCSSLLQKKEKGRSLRNGPDLLQLGLF